MSNYRENILVVRMGFALQMGFQFFTFFGGYNKNEKKKKRRKQSILGIVGSKPCVCKPSGSEKVLCGFPNMEFPMLPGRVTSRRRTHQHKKFH